MEDKNIDKIINSEDELTKEILDELTNGTGEHNE